MKLKYRDIEAGGLFPAIITEEISFNMDLVYVRAMVNCTYATTEPILLIDPSVFDRFIDPNQIEVDEVLPDIIVEGSK